MVAIKRDSVPITRFRDLEYLSRQLTSGLFTRFCMTDLLQSMNVIEHTADCEVEVGGAHPSASTFSKTFL